MPELPEVEVVRRGISRWAMGRTVESVTVHDPRSLRRHALGAALDEPARLGSFTTALTQQRLLAPQRRGKFLWIPLDRSTTAATAAAQPGSGTAPVGESLLIHLGMSGQVLIDEPSAPAQKHLKITLELGGEDSAPKQLRFIDQRIFGGMQISELVPSTHPSGSVPAAAVHIAPDPLEPGFDEETFFRTLRRRKTGLKRALLDQGMVSGIGNIYADEALWLARLHYLRSTQTITRAESARLLSGVKTVLLAALEAGGTSFDALYVNVNGASGYFSRSLNVYGQQGRPCPRCGTEVRRETFMNRGSHFCPKCQPGPRPARLRASGRA
ncbi:bifunctional DNA-formamidopyrimidine glycosylase/DNA-(apurinic or apyrimidinic site) lyase [Nesterenkonia sp. E16_7]|uniref:bifunctional DNA-formamidopyrimidine glycosylase/DNA-(apurinic or apyrimidinic site) lyase n=1 Tax=unclassified Nesterenkonia TaxID=2629769 RepID=UPI001A922E72|nr:MULTISPECIES: bifunctional DNA-formamidopyrimidine glycosylase/DNA-(apurinic or apyrimidinic site) lyase [unclassified Nesterenkonia]MBO0594441.1 bifunctional DNA-formamidopyrimidine glycosylase/DNA-(apurinic or apyrimidinic site) lyase [Nesterenkonia sp. E16_10]MBO0598849.1 bifunctional DNA-formamidopyrimidine glycosylase/DNA-(apurinic or apyrimidinic site) lyase [Nesterenkonia sp. E16_7]